MIKLILLALLSFTSTALAGGGAKLDQSPDGESGTISFSPPDLSDEEAHSNFMPDNLKCEGCKAVAYQFYIKFKKSYDRRRSTKGRLPESDIIELTDAVCTSKESFENYGIKDVNKVKHLTGPGLKDLSTGPSVTQGGGKWPSRLHDMCEEFVGDIGDVEIYEAFLAKPTDPETLEDFLCYGEGIRGRCNERGFRDEL